MGTILFTGLMCVIWAFSLLNGTGLGTVYHTAEIFRWGLVALTAAVLVRKRTALVRRDLFFSFGALFLLFCGTALVHGYLLTTLQYLCIFLLVYLLSNLNVRTMGLRLTGLAFAVLGAAILVIYNYGTALSGWNENSIAMVGLFSYLILVAANFDLRFKRSRLVLLLITALFFWLILPTESRSCLVALLLTCLVALFMKPDPKLLRKKGNLVWLLLVPLLTVGLAWLLNLLDMVPQLDVWSLAQTGKQFFSGRDTTWLLGMQQMTSHPFFGSGKVDSIRFHNSAVTCLSAYGILGYLVWLRCIYILLKRGIPYLKDHVVTGCMAAFMIMYLQQSVELGMITSKADPLLYLPLGLMLGRVRFLKGESGK